MNQEDLAYFVGIICGDGYVSQKNFVIEIKDDRPDFLKNVYSPLIERLFSKRPRVVRDSDGQNTFRCYFWSKEASKLLKEWGIVSPKSFTVCAPLWIKNGNKIIKVNFLRGVMDTDGSIYEKKNRNITNYPTIALIVRSKGLAEDVYNIFIELGFNVKMGVFSQRGKPMFMVRLYGFAQLKGYMDRIGFNHPNKVSKATSILKSGIIRAGRSTVDRYLR